MFKGFYSWHIARKRQKFFKKGLLVKDSLLPQWLKKREKAKYVEGDGFYSYEKRAKKRLYRYAIAVGLLIYACVWFLYESYLGWGIFG